MEHCIGGCSGESTSALHYDFNTIIALSELNPDVIGFGGFDAAHANCTVKVDTIEVPLFEGGDAFQTFAERHRINSGMSALDNTWCDSNPLSCGAIQQALERSPGLVFVPGVGWRHRYDMVPPSPPPPPFPPPRTLFCTCHLHNPPYMTRTHTHTHKRSATSDQRRMLPPLADGPAPPPPPPPPMTPPPYYQGACMSFERMPLTVRSSDLTV